MAKLPLQRTRGLRDRDELSDENLVRDTRGVISQLIDFLGTPQNMTVALVCLAVAAFLFYGVGDLILIVALLLAWYGLTRREEAALKLPIQSELMDPVEGGSGKPKKAAGIFFIGNDKISGKEVWLTNSDARTHFIVLGTTGAGKTETLLGFAANALSWGSGFLFVDGKGDVSLYAKAYALTRRMGREDDLLVMNFMTGGTDVSGGSGGVSRSNTLNPFTSGSSDQLTQMCVSLMDDAGGDGAVWKGRAVAMLGGIMRALVWKRDQGEIDLNIGIIRDYLSLDKIIELAAEETLPPNIKNAIVKYLAQIPGFDKSKGTKQAQQTMEQHGYLQMQFSKVLATAADVYGFIFMTPFGEIDMADVVLNRRILIVMLPSLEKSPLETENLGKIVVANLKGMMGQALGDSLTGTWNDVVEKRSTSAPSPFVTIMDEVGYYMVEGMDMMAAQARSLGFCLVFAGQDVNAMKKKNEKVADAVISNCNTTIAMKVEDPQATADLIIKKGGKGLRAFSAGYDANVGEIGMRYSDRNSAEIKEVDKINFLDLKGQDEGEMHIVWKTRLVRAKGFYVNPPSALDVNKLLLAPNQFLKVSRPNPEDVSLKQRLPAIAETLSRADHVDRMRRAAEELTSTLQERARKGDELAVCAVAIDVVRTSKNPRDRTEAAAASVAA
ncbi:type IV secretory system conjugative DNA transfer family protein, partial [Methylobacterium hispanicum]